MLKYGIKPEVEAFDLSMIFQAVAMQKAGKISGPLHEQFVMGVKNAMPVDRHAFGGHCRTGLEDNVRMDRETLAPSNAALVRQTAEICAQYGRRPATAAEARSILSL
jgi:3-oxoadipate:acetyl-CoA acetyltransferase